MIYCSHFICMVLVGTKEKEEAGALLSAAYRGRYYTNFSSEDFVVE